MSREERRRKTGWWVLALLGLIFAAIGIRFASSSDWWASISNGQRQNFQTINTGASVQVATSTSDRVPIQSNTVPPVTRPDNSTNDSQQPIRRMW